MIPRPSSSRPAPDALRTHLAWVAAVALLAGSVYVTALGNGFARDDHTILEQRELVRRGAVTEALSAPWWAESSDGQGTLYRPVALAFLAAQWSAFDGDPAGFHAVSVLLHVVASVCVLLLLASVIPLTGAAAGAAVFAVHPVHVEAVANVVGQAELLAAVLATLAALLYLRSARQEPGAVRALLWVGVAGLYLLALSSKEIAVSLPALLVLLAVTAGGEADGTPRRRAVVGRLLDETPLLLLLLGVLVAYLGVRAEVLGSVMGEVPAPELIGLGGLERVQTALSVWPEYVRLLLIPLDLEADYGPAVLFPARALDPGVILGAIVAAALVVGAVASSFRHPVVALGTGWLIVSLLPVSNLFFATGILLAERTLYLPSIGVAVVAGYAFGELLERMGPRRAWAALAAIVVALGARTAVRNPVWASTEAVVASIEADHPRSNVVLQARAVEAFNAGRTAEAERLFAESLALLPFHYGHVVEVAQVKAVLGKWAEAEELFVRAIGLRPAAAPAYELWAARLLAAGRPEAGRRVAAVGLARVEAPRRLWTLIAESWTAEGRAAEASRAREAAGG